MQSFDIFAKSVLLQFNRIPLPTLRFNSTEGLGLLKKANFEQQHLGTKGVMVKPSACSPSTPTI